MRIAGISAVFPSRIMTNEDILGLISKESDGHFQGDLGHTLRKISYLFKYSGLQRRRWASQDEKPIQLLARAVSQALVEAHCTAADIDLLIYTGVGGGFREPGNSYMVAHALNLTSAQCFDLIDACMSWTRAMQMAYHLFRGESNLRRVMIVNAEFNMYAGGPGWPGLFRLRDEADLEGRFPAFTIGEAATATILERDPARDWEFHFSSRPDLAELCTIPTNGYENYCAIGLTDSREDGLYKTAQNGPGLFTSFASELFAHVEVEGPVVFRKLRCAFEDIRMVFPHAASEKLWRDMGRQVGSPPTYYVYPEYGNIVSASIPAGIDLARKEGLITRGDRLVGWPASAGMSFAAYSFVY